MKQAKLIFIGIIILFVIVAYLNFFVFNKWGIGCQPEPWPEPEVIVNDWEKPLTESGYKPATVEKPEYIGEDKFPETVESVLYAGGTVQDSVDVQVSVVETPDGDVWVKAEVDGEEVKFTKIQYSQIRKPDRGHNWSLIVAGEWVDGADAGIGIAWEPLSYRGAYFGLQAVCDVNADLRDSPDWGSLSARVSRRFGAVSVGGYSGYRFGESQGLAIGIDCGVVLGL